MNSISDNVKEIRKQIEAACTRSGRNVNEICIVAISKGFGAQQISEVAQAGILDIGENYLNESLAKQAELQPLRLGIRWHFTGHLQRNKAESVASRFSLIQGVDSLRLLETLQQTSKKLQKEIDILLQVKIHPQAAHGFSPMELSEILSRCSHFPDLRIRGLMTLGIPTESPEQARPLFKQMKNLFDEQKKIAPSTFQELSMGMSGDFEVAVEEGATMVRIGRAIFGERAKG